MHIVTWAFLLPAVHTPENVELLPTKSKVKVKLNANSN